MSLRERGNVWPIVSVFAGATFVLVIVPLILHRQTSARMATVDPDVSIADGAATRGSSRDFPLAARRFPLARAAAPGRGAGGCQAAPQPIASCAADGAGG